MVMLLLYGCLLHIFYYIYTILVKHLRKNLDTCSMLLLPFIVDYIFQGKKFGSFFSFQGKIFGIFFSLKGKFLYFCT